MSDVRVVSARIAFGGGLPVHGAGNARARWRERRGLILGLTDDRGRVGLGECTPLPGYSPRGQDHDLDACAAELGELDRAGCVVSDVAGIAAIAGAVRAPAARFAVETALLDLLGQEAGLPVADILARAAPVSAPVRDTTPLDGAPLSRMPLSRVPVNALIVDTADIDDALAAVARAYARGVRCFKIKIGRPGGFEHELALLGAVRARHGLKVALRLDANRAWSAGEAAGNLARLAEIAPEYVEEPLMDAGALGRAFMPLPGAAAVALDESLAGADPAWIADLMARGVVRALVLKPMLLGGALPCLALAAMARAHGAAAVVSHLFDGPVALTACAHLALVVGGTCGLDRHAGLDAWPAHPLPLVRESHIAYDPAPGLGIGESLRRALLWPGEGA
jgi:o-succinylbenzoate synthase